MYTFRYDCFDDVRFPGFTDGMNRLYNRSISSLGNSPRQEQVFTLKDIFGYIEYYLVGLLKEQYVTKKNFSYILNRFNELKLVELLDPVVHGKVNGLSYGNRIALNPEPGEYVGLNKNESLQLAAYHELGHCIASGNEENIQYLTAYVQKLYPKTLQGKNYQYFSDGFTLLEETAVETAGEKILFSRKKEPRPETVCFRSKRLFPEGTFSSNLLEYREFQEVAYRFLSCLSLIKGETMDDVLDEFVSLLFSSDYCQKMSFEFQEDPKKGKNLVRMLICMGKIKEAKYSLFGYGSFKRDEVDVSSSYQEIIQISNSYQSACQFAKKIQR